MKRLFMLGAPDPEMERIKEVLTEAGEDYKPFTFKGKRVNPSTAYKADNEQEVNEFINGDIDTRILMVEGRFKNGGFPSPIPISIIDHHKPGHPGYGLPPEKYMEASSLGQVLDVLDRGYTATDRLTAAADHCLGHAYQGKCPGVNPAELAAWRAKSRSKFLGIDLKAYLKMVEQAKTRIADLPVLSIHGARFLDSRNHQIRELPEASVQLGVPVLYSSAMKGGKYKEGILSATPEEIRAWKHWVSCREYYALTDIYGDPSRGYAGGYHYVKN